MKAADAIRMTGIFAIVVVMAGCASTPKSTKTGSFDHLYDGKEKVAYATEMPVENVTEAMSRGDKALSRGDRDLALYRYVQALELNPKTIPAYERIGTIHLERDRLALAARTFRSGLRFDNEHPALNEGLGLALLRARRYDESQQVLERAVQIDVRRWRAHNGLGILADLRGEHDVARESYETALLLVPTSARVHNNLGYSLYLSRDYHQAIARLKTAVHRDPEYERAWHNLGLVLARTGRYQEAVAAFQRVTDKPGAYNNVGYLSLHNDDLDSAQKYLDRAVHLSPQYYEKAHENLEVVGNRSHRAGAD
ncbi:tetratricopeptide repeat protein [Thiohalomonas denitrificans]|uniref:Flp pilus assembly protein TadD, contains TPR repeats n=1 Tax=Thiohalomonas denitrificans TaxID=415747 RepID=A0A1G5QEQ3_9GAMM|nr:tetratricopeptide repeat protein [Thiohalomonas denitrificans]SCZ60167.1 Flp pilus assembly protein TadD, contains TPR repeats [Thiohalomonas denitrificans]